MPVFLRWLLRLGPLNPVAVRLVQGGSRRKRHLYIRSTYLGVLIVVLLYILLTVGAGQKSLSELAAAGARSFVLVAYLQIALICILAPVFMAGAIAQEANPRTWDILLTTPLKPGEIVLGNLFGRLFFILALLFSSLPLFAVTQYYGGVPGRSIFLSYVIAACAALLVGSIAIALSVSRLVGKRAVFAFYVSVVSYLAVTFAIDRLISTGGVTWMTGVNPFLSLYALLNPSEYASAAPGTHGGLTGMFLERPVLTWCVLSGLISLGLVFVSSLTVRIGGIAGLGGQGGRGGVPLHRRIFGLGASGSQSRPSRHVWHNAIAWREAAARNATLGRIVARWTFIALGALGGIGLIAWYAGGDMSPVLLRQVLAYLVLGELGVIALVSLNMAATSVAREREDGTLDLLLTTPITPGQYLSGKLRGIVAYLLPLLAVPIGTLGLGGLASGLAQGEVLHPKDGGMVSVAVALTGGTLSVPAVIPEAFVLASLVVIPFIAFCVVVGMQWSLKSKGSLSAVVATVAIVGVVAGIVGLCAWQAGSGVEGIGPAACGLSPATVVFACIYPEVAMAETVLKSGSLVAARVGLFIGALIAAAIYIAVVYGVHANMVRTFDFTVRKLAGNK